MIQFPQFTRKLPIPVIALVTALFTGVLVWGVLDKVQTSLLAELLDEELNVLVEQRARGALSRYGIFVNQYKTVTRLLASHGWMHAYLDEEFARMPEKGEIRINPHKLQWAWSELLKHSSVPPQWLIITDSEGEVRAITSENPSNVPEELLKIDSFYLDQSTVGPLVLVIDHIPYLLLGQPVADSLHEEEGVLLVVISMRDLLGNPFLNGLSEGALFALLEDDYRVIASSDQDIIEPNHSIYDYDVQFEIKTQALLGFELSDTGALFVTLIPKEQLTRISDKFILFERWQRFIGASVFVAIFLLVAFLFSYRLNRTLVRISRLAHSALGVNPSVEESNNKLYLLEDWVQELVCTFHRIRKETANRHASQIQQTEALKTAISDSSPDSIVTIDQHCLIVDVNSTAEQRFNLQLQDVVGTPFQLLLDHKSIAPFNQLIQANSKPDGDNQIQTIDLDAANGDERFPVELTLVCIMLGDHILFTLHIHDLSVRKQQEQQIRSLARFANESPEPILRINEFGSIIYANEASDILLAYWNCARGQKLPQYWDTKVRQSISDQNSFEQVIDTGACHCSLLFVPVSDSKYLNIYARDITDTINAEKLARQHQTELVHVCRLSTMGEMATGIAHELNQPLAAITNYSSGCLRRLDPKTETDHSIFDAIEQINKQAQRASNIIRSMRAMITSQEPNRTLIDCNKIVEEVNTFLSFELTNANIHMSCRYTESPVFIRGDLVQIEQVLLNIIKNAIDAFADTDNTHRHIQINIVENKTLVNIVVTDNGPGIDEAIIDDLFNPFVSTKTDGMGMGMGLAISATIMNDHNGKILLESQPGEKTVFTLQFPGIHNNANA